MKRFILARKAKGGVVVVVEQHLRLAEAIADEFLVMDQGRAVLRGGAPEIGRDRLVAHLEV